MTLFESFRLPMIGPNAPREPEDIVVLLEASVKEACTDLRFDEAEIWCGGQIVTMFPTPRHPWEAVVIGPDAYQLYHGFLRDNGETVVWANVWVADDYTLEKFVAVLEDEFLKAAADTL